MRSPPPAACRLTRAPTSATAKVRRSPVGALPRHGTPPRARTTPPPEELSPRSASIPGFRPACGVTVGEAPAGGRTSSADASQPAARPSHPSRYPRSRSDQEVRRGRSADRRRESHRGGRSLVTRADQYGNLSGAWAWRTAPRSTPTPTRLELRRPVLSSSCGGQEARARAGEPRLCQRPVAFPLRGEHARWSSRRGGPLAGSGGGGVPGRMGDVREPRTNQQA